MKVTAAALVMLACVLPVAADPAPPLPPPRDQVIAFLQLSDDQAVQWDALVESYRNAADPLREAVAEVDAALRDLFAAGAPDAAAVGELVIQRHELLGALAAEQEIYLSGFEALLDDEQAGRLAFIRRADLVQPVIPAFERFGLIPPRPPLPPDPTEG